MAVKKFLKDVQKIQEQHQDRGGHSPPESAHDESNWLVSYADMMTLLCGFFIMMFSMATLDVPKYDKMKEALAKQFHGEYKAPATKDLAEFMTQIVQEAGITSETLVRWDATGASIAFQSTIFFDTMNAGVKPRGREILEKLIDGVALRQKKDGKQYKVVVEGHTDSRPITSSNGPYPTNWELSGARAASVVRMFVDRGFDPGTLTAIGYADTRPEVASRNPAGGWNEVALGKNRRVVLRILEPAVEAIPFPEISEALAGAKAAAVGVAAKPAVGAGAGAAVGVDAGVGAKASAQMLEH